MAARNVVRQGAPAGVVRAGYAWLGGVLLAGGVVGSAFLAAPAARAQDAPEGDPAAGRRVATAVCQTCHGMDGLHKLPEMPNIAGSDPAYIVRQLQAYKAGERQNELMAAVAPMLDDKKMADVAAYYGALQVTTAPP